MIDLPTIRDRLKTVMRAHMDAANIPGLALALTDRDRTVWVAAEGYADLAAGTPLTADMLFAIGSIGKSFTSIALLQEQDAGNLDLDQPVTRYLPWFAVRSTHAPITIRHLLSHSSGLGSTSDFATSDWPHVLALREIEVVAPPGRHFSYSNDGYKTLGVVLRAITGRPYGDVIRARILEPLGMRATDPVIGQETRRRMAVGHEPFYDDRPARRSDPLVRVNWFETETADGCVAGSAGDLAIFLRMLLNRGRGPMGAILSERSFAQMSARAIESAPGEWYGYGLRISEEDEHTIIGHGGGVPGFVSAMTADMDAGVGAVALVNALADPGPIANYARKLLRAAVSGGAEPDAPTLCDPTVVENARDYQGIYRGDAMSFEITAEKDRLLMDWKAERLTLEPRGPDAFLVPHADFTLFLLRFERRDGRVTAAWSGPERYAGERSGGSTPAGVPPAAWAAYAGHYRSFSPWLSNFRVITREQSLLVILPTGAEAPLVPAGEARFEVDGWAAGLRFGPVVGGRAIEATLGASNYYRVDAP